MSEQGKASEEEQERWIRLTEKQRACLDLLVERQTSKQIGRALDISKYTVDQRLKSARNILGTATRDDTAIVYARLRRICDRVVYHPVDIPARHDRVPSMIPDGGRAGLALSDSVRTMDRPSGMRLPSGGLWRPDHSSSGRMSITAAMVVAAAIFIAAGVVISLGLSELVSR